MQSRSMTQRISPLFVALAVGGAALVAAMLVRHLVVESQAMGMLCDNPGGPVWCHGRQGVILLFKKDFFAAASVLLAIAALFSRRHAASLAVAAVAFGAAGAVLYNLEWAVPGLLLGLLRAARLDAGRAAS